MTRVGGGGGWWRRRRRGGGGVDSASCCVIRKPASPGYASDELALNAAAAAVCVYAHIYCTHTNTEADNLHLLFNMFSMSGGGGGGGGGAAGQDGNSWLVPKTRK